MDQKKFEQILDQLADWYLDTNPPIKGTHTTTAHAVATGPRRRVRKCGELVEQNFEGAWPQVVKFYPVLSECRRCQLCVENIVEEINLEKQTVKCSCGQRYSLKLIQNNPID